MRFKLFVFPILTVCLFAAAVPAFSQTDPDYEGRGMLLSVGVGPSSYDADWGHGRMYGGTLWIDLYPPLEVLPPFLRGLGLDMEARDISLDRSASQTNVRQDTAGGGPIYNWRHFHKFHLYGKFLHEQGSFDFTPLSPTYAHDTRHLWAYGGGFEYRLYRRIRACADYEYQIWQPFRAFGNKRVDPQGVTVGVSYNIPYPRPH